MDKSFQGHADRNPRIATPDHAGLLASARRRFCHTVDIARRARHGSALGGWETSGNTSQPLPGTPAPCPTT